MTCDTRHAVCDTCREKHTLPSFLGLMVWERQCFEDIYKPIRYQLGQERNTKKSCIWETPNLSTNADGSTDTKIKVFFLGVGAEVGRTDKGGSQISHTNKSSVACQCGAM